VQSRHPHRQGGPARNAHQVAVAAGSRRRGLPGRPETPGLRLPAALAGRAGLAGLPRGLQGLLPRTEGRTMRRQLRPTDVKRLNRTWRRNTANRLALILESVTGPFNVGSI